MRNFLAVFTVLTVFLCSSPAAMAETFYFYKVAGKKLEKSARSDTYHILSGASDKFPDKVYVAIDLPEMPSPLQVQSGSDKRDEIRLGFRIHTTATYYFFIKDLVIRDERKNYSLLTQAEVDNLPPDWGKGLGEHVFMQTHHNQSINGKIQSKYEMKIDSSNSYGDTFLLKMSASLPDRIYLDYKFRIRKEGGSEEMFEGTIPLEIVSYRPGLWERIWR